MKTLEIIFGDSCNYTMKKSKLGNNEILMINALFNIGDLSNISHYKINIPKELCLDDKNINVKAETFKIIDSIKKKYIIRVWTGHNDIYSYLVMLYVSSIIEMYNYEMHILYSDEYNKEYISPSMMKEEELEELTKLEKKLTKEEITNNSNIWKKLVKENSNLRVLENQKIKSVSLHYYDEYILNTLTKSGKVMMRKLVADLMINVYLQDILYVYLIDNLIKDNKIKITIDNDRYFKSFIEINNNC